MFVYLLMASLLFSPSHSAQPQTATVNVKVRVVLVDKDLNQKPVPFYLINVRPDGAANAPLELKTDLDGKAEKQLAPGHYAISTPKPIELGGKRYTWNFEIQIAGAEQSINLTNDNAKIEDLAPSASSAEKKSSSGGGDGDLTALFDKLKNSVVAVHSEFGSGSGFLVDARGLVVTNNHVVNASTYLAVQFDDKRKVPARLIASNSDKDVAVIWFDPAAFREGVVAPLLVNDAASHLVVGQRVFTIGNPFDRTKALTTGVVSKIDKDAINSDININPGNSGGPLFTLDGQVAGITTSLLRNLASIVPVEIVRPVVEQARKDIVGGAPPAPLPLPVEPADMFPADALRQLLIQEKTIDMKPYEYDAGEFRVWFTTPPVSYVLRHEQEMAAARKAAKRSGGDSANVKPSASVLEDAQDYRPVLLIRVRPKFGVMFKVRFKNGFVRMRLLCDGKEVAPILPGRGEFDLYDQRGRKVDTTFQGAYEYGPDALTPACGNVSVEIYSEKDSTTPVSKSIDGTTVQHVWEDFAPFRQAFPAPAAAAKP